MRQGGDTVNYQKLIIAGNVTRNAERRTSQTGDVDYTTFGVAVSDSKDRATFFPITLFGRMGETLTEYITKRRHILVEGRVSVGENGYFSVIADRVELGTAPRKADDKGLIEENMPPDLHADIE
jgi:hypothetical protein